MTSDLRINMGAHSIWIDVRRQLVWWRADQRSDCLPFAEVEQVELFVARTGFRKILRFAELALDLGSAVSRHQALMEAREIARTLVRPLRLFEKDHRDDYFVGDGLTLSPYGQPTLHEAPPSRGSVRVAEFHMKDTDPMAPVFRVDTSDLYLA